MSLLTLMESTGYLQREITGRDSQQGQTQTWNTISTVVPCSVQTMNGPVRILYSQRNADNVVTVYLAQDIGAQVSDRFIATDRAGNQSLIKVMSESQQVNQDRVWVMNGIQTEAPTGTSTSVGVAGFLVSVPDEVVQGIPFNFTVTAKDAQGNTVTGYGGTVQFYSSDYDAVLPADTTLTNGTGTFSATLNTLGTQQVGAQDNVNYAINTLSDDILVIQEVAQSNLAGNSNNFAGSSVMFAGAE